MTESDKQRIRAELPNYLTERGVNLKKPFICLNPGHQDKTPSMSFDAKDGQHVKCFSCDVYWDIFDLIEAEYRLTKGQGLSKARELFPFIGNNTSVGKRTGPAAKRQPEPKENITMEAKEYIEQCQKRMEGSPALDYMVKRGIDPELLSQHRIGYDPGHRLGLVVVMPNDNDSYTVRTITGKAFQKSPGQGLFNADSLLTGRPVFIVESVIDALSVMTAGGQALALGSTGNNQLIKTIKDNQLADKTTPYLVISLDNDEAGQSAAKALSMQLKELKVTHTDRNISGSFNDPNERLTKDKQGLIEAVNGISSEYRERNQQKVIELLQEIERNTQRKAISTGYDRLDEILNGGLQKGLYVIGALPSLGKTAFILQVSDYVSEHGQDVLFFSYEMSANELRSRSVSRITNKRTSNQILSGSFLDYDSKVEVMEAIEDYQETIAKHLFIVEATRQHNASEITNEVNKHISLTGQLPVVVIDYLQIMPVSRPGLSDKQSMDQTVLELKQLSRDLDLPVVVISSLNRASYTKSITMEAFKESGAIEYGTDVLIGLQIRNRYNGNGGSKTDSQYHQEAAEHYEKETSKAVRDIELKVIKNRNGIKGTVNLEYKTAVNYIREAPDQ